jgi:acyl-coenzyme A thioesterase PaaI-like protein
MAFADTAMVIANLAANRGYRPMTTVDQTTHFMRAATASDVLADARVSPHGHHELWPCHPVSAHDNSRWRWYRALSRC